MQLLEAEDINQALSLPDGRIEVLNGNQTIELLGQAINFTQDPMEKITIGMSNVGNTTESIAVKSDKGDFVSILVISPNGDNLYRGPSFITGFTHPDFRRKGFALNTLRVAIRYCKDICGFPKMHIDVISQGTHHMLKQLTKEERDYLDITDNGMYLDRSPLSGLG
ncbi:MAG: hypothetical protein ACOCXQ_03950 [Patescibacteria group bacterium]